MLSISISFITLFANLVLGFFVLQKNYKDRTLQLFTFFVLGVALWTIANYFSLNSPDKEMTYFWINIVDAIVSIMFTTLYLFIINFPHSDFSISRKRMLFFVLFTSTVVLANLGGFVFRDIVISPGVSTSIGNITPVPGPAMPLFALNVMVLPVYSFFLLFKRTRSFTGLVREQFRWMFYGLSLTFLLAIITNFIFVNLLHRSDFVIFGPFFTLIFVLCTTYAIVAHHLFDIYIVIRRGIVFSVNFLIIVFTLTAVTYSTRTVVAEPVPTLLAALMVTIVFQPLRMFLERLTNRIFFQKHYVLDDVLDELIHLLSETIHLDILLELFLKRLKQLLQIEKGLIALLIEKDHFVTRQCFGSDNTELVLAKDNPIVKYINIKKGQIIDRNYLMYALEQHREEGGIMAKDVVKELERLGFSLAIPIRAKDKLIGVCLLSDKKSGDLYSAYDFKLLELVMHEAGTYIENARLYEQEKAFVARLKLADNAKSEFISVVSHQFRTPLSAIRWNTDLLEDALASSGTSAPRHDFLDSIRQNTLFLNNTLANIFDTLVIEGGQTSLEYQPVQLWEVVDQVIAEIKDFAKVFKVEIRFDKNNIPLQEIQADPQKLKRIFYIVLQNAIEYSKAGEGIVSITIHLAEEHTVQGLAVDIRDNGIGIAPADLSKIFDKFFRGENAKKISPNGTGLGLFIVAEILKAHGGSVHIMSELSKGTAVSLFLPFVPTKNKQG